MVKILPTSATDMGSIPGSGRSLEKKMAMHSSLLALEIPWTEETGRLQSMRSQRVGHDLETKQKQFINTYIDLKFWILCQLSHREAHIYLKC